MIEKVWHITSSEWNATRIVYNEMTANHPTIHCNRFPAWEELSSAEQTQLVKKYATEGKL